MLIRKLKTNSFNFHFKKWEKKSGNSNSKSKRERNKVKSMQSRKGRELKPKIGLREGFDEIDKSFL